MTAQNSFTPEKELLRLIEKPGREGSLRAAAIKHHGLSLFSFSALKARIAFLKNKFRDFKIKGFRELDVKALNRILNFFIVILVFYFVVNLSTSITHLKQPLDIKSGIEKKSETKLSAVPSLLKAASYYLERVRERDLFSMGAKKISNTVKGPSSRIIEATQNLKLVGISWSNDPDVMIEDTQNHRTLFLKKGRLINNEIKVEAIFKDKVVLSYQGEEIELR